MVYYKQTLMQSEAQLNASASDVWDGSCSYQDAGGADQPCQHFKYSSLDFSHTANMQVCRKCSQLP